MKGRIVGHGKKARFFLDGREVSREEFDAVFPDQGLAGGDSLVGWKPLASEALAVHPRQIAEAEESARRKGVPTEFDSQGRPVFTSRSHRRQYLRAYNFHDKDGGYSD